MGKGGGERPEEEAPYTSGRLGDSKMGILGDTGQAIMGLTDGTGICFSGDRHIG